MAIQERQPIQIGAQLPDVFPSDHREQETVNYGELMQVIHRRRRLIIISTLIIFGLGMLYTSLVHPRYESTGSILVEAQNNNQILNNSLPLVSDLMALTQAQSVDTQVELLQSPVLLEAAFNHLTIKDRVKGFKSDHFIFSGSNKTSSYLTVSAAKDTNVITIDVIARNPQSAANYANSIAKTFEQQDHR